MNLPDTDPTKYPIAQLYLKRDIRWVFLFYLERYLIHQSISTIDKYCRISIWDIKNNRDIDMYGADTPENLIKIFRKLIRPVHKRNYAKQFRAKGSKKLVEHIGYIFEIKKTSAYEYPSY